MNENKDVNIIHALITFVILSLCFGFYTDFGDKYGYKISNREQDEIIQFFIIIAFASVIVFFMTKNLKSPFSKTSISLNEKLNNSG